jgi:hypothetical protein
MACTGQEPRRRPVRTHPQPPHACHRCQPTGASCTHARHRPAASCMHTLTTTTATSAPRLIHASVHTARAQRLPPGPPAPRCLFRQSLPTPHERHACPQDAAPARRTSCQSSSGSRGRGSATTHRMPPPSDATQRSTAPVNSFLGRYRPLRRRRRVGATDPFVVVVVSALHGPRRIAASGARNARGKKPPVATRERISKAPATHTNVRGRMACTGNKPFRQP